MVGSGHTPVDEMVARPNKIRYAKKKVMSSDRLLHAIKVDLLWDAEAIGLSRTQSETGFQERCLPLSQRS